MEEKIVLAGGCFWCIEAVLAGLKGVSTAVSGYTGGEKPNPTYEQVSTGSSGHAEVVEVTFDSKEISLHDLLTIFFTLHDPTTLNRQGADRGTQYRSAIFYANDEQKDVAQQVMQEISQTAVWQDPLVTEVTPLKAFYPAEVYHQHYYENNANQGYCRVVIEPKVAKLRKLYHDKLKA